MKKIVLVSMVKNEADIIESFVRHSLTYADELIVADHQSSDATWDILQKLRVEGLPLTLHRLYRVELAHREVMNRLTREAITEHGAELVLPFDADEFLVNDENNLSCRQVLETLDPENLYCLRWRVYEPLLPDQDRDRFLLSRSCKREQDFHGAQKTIVGADGYQNGRPYELVQGAHFGKYLDDGSSVPMIVVPFLHTAHFHWRSSDQYETKIATSWLNNVSKYTVHTVTASYLKGGFDSLMHHESAARESIMEHAAEKFNLSSYVKEQELRYTSTERADVQANVMAAAERIAEQLAETKVLLRQKIVTMILVWSGQEEASWRRTLRCVCDQTYPYLEIFVLGTSNEQPPYLKELKEREERAGRTVTWIPAAEASRDASDGSWAQQLEERSHGDYVQWLLPDEVITPDKVQHMVAFLEMQDQNFGAAFASGREEQAGRWQAGEYFHLSEPILANVPENFRKHFLKTGHYPIGGLSAGLFRRHILSAVRWLEPCFLDGRPMLFVMWQELLRAMQSSAQRGFVAVLRGSFCEVPQDVTPDDFLWWQLQWANMLQAEREPSDTAQTGWKIFRALGGDIRQQEAVLKQSSLYPAYLQLLDLARTYEQC